MKQTRLWIACAVAAAFVAPSLSSHAAPAKKPVKKAGAKAPAKKPVKKTAAQSAANMQLLKLALPKPAFIGTPKNIPAGTTVEKPTGKARPAFYVPKGTVLLSAGKEVTSSDSAPVIGELTQVTDGNKEAGEGNYVELGPYKQWVQIDLGKSAAIHAIVLWHHHSEAAVYRDVIVQVSDDKDFVEGVKTVYNNDQDGSYGVGRGKDREYFELFDGRLIPVKGVKGRYVRLHSNGSTSADENRYTEVEVYGK
jgi:hypothetical protein